MADPSEMPFSRQLLDRMTTGVTKSLEKRPGVCNIELHERPQVMRHHLTSWEQRNACTLPDDLKSFYQMTDGMLLTWSVKLDGETVQPIGRMELNPIKEVTKIAGDKIARRTNPSLADLDYDSDDEMAEDAPPRFDHQSRIFELDPCQGCGHVCLVYRNTKQGAPAEHAEVWFLDSALRWHFLSTSFSQYFRLMMVHMGLPQWQYAFTDIGLSPLSKQWFNIYGPHRLQVDSDLRELLGWHEKEDDSSRGKTSGDSVPLQKLDVTKVFKGKSDKKNKTSAGQPKKKLSTSNKPMSGGIRSSQHVGSNRYR
ncbi:tubulin polyglutamylase complex subunit 2-like [Diadema antillarum]|uniref:tubulin polyglutamylase complex subunit 2-like n=1 Tax=Diadema antillarum TaxID=105358 RepID=UPI003A8ABCF4